MKQKSKFNLYGFFERLCPPQVKLSRDPHLDTGARLNELGNLYAEFSQRVHAPLTESDVNLSSARNLRRKRKLLREIVQDRLPREEFLREVRMLESSPDFEKPQDYWEALKSFLPTPMFLETLPGYMDQRNSLGTTSFEPTRNRIYIRVPQRLGWWNFQYALAHEVGHVAANHEFPVLDTNGHISEFKRPPEGLTRLPAITNTLPREAVLDLQDEEAELRARYTWLVCGLGEQVLNLGKAKQLS